MSSSAKPKIGGDSVVVYVGRNRVAIRHAETIVEAETLLCLDKAVPNLHRSTYAIFRLHILLLRSNDDYLLYIQALA